MKISRLKALYYLNVSIPEVLYRMKLLTHCELVLTQYSITKFAVDKNKSYSPLEKEKYFTLGTLNELNTMQITLLSF